MVTSPCAAGVQSPQQQFNNMTMVNVNNFAAPANTTADAQPSGFPIRCTPQSIGGVQQASLPAQSQQASSPSFASSANAPSGQNMMNMFASLAQQVALIFQQIAPKLASLTGANPAASSAATSANTLAAPASTQNNGSGNGGNNGGSGKKSNSDSESSSPMGVTSAAAGPKKKKKKCSNCK